jgi:hypothetical protein
MAHHVQDCHWSVPTLLMPRPYWYSAWEAPWSCWNNHDIRVLDSTDVCENCPMWRPRAAHAGIGREVPPEGAVPYRAED